MTEQEYVTRNEHKEFARRFEAEEERQNARLASVEKRVDDLYDVKTTISVISLKIDTVSEELARLRKDVEELRFEPADNWKTVKRIILSVVVTAIATAAVAAILQFI